MSFLNATSSQGVVSSRRTSRQGDQTAAVEDLENDIARFQAILTDDDRKNLQQLKTEPHDTHSIIMFTASLDRFDPKRRGKSVASRLASFLQTIEQFTHIVETYIQSNPEIAALVWGSVKLTFQLLANFTSYFQSFVELLSGFGTLCSRFAEYQVIFKDSLRLNEIRGYVEDIKSKAETVRDDIQLVKAQSDSEEHQLQAKARQKAEESHGRISSLLTKARSEMRLIGDHGIRGTAVVTDLQFYMSQEKIKQPEQFISFFFSRFDNPNTLASGTIVRSLVQQLLSVAPLETANPAHASEIADSLQKARDNFFSLDTLEKLYQAASKLAQDWFIIIDGVDECESEQQRLLYDFLSRLLETCSGPQRIKILISSRETTKQDIERSFSSVERLITGTSNTSADIVAFAEDIIVAKRIRGELVVRDEAMIDDILDVIASKEEGMFLWAFLAIEDICSGTNDKEIRKALQEIPADLPATFDRALSRITKRRNQTIASEIFGWTATARQPLTLTQLQEALSIEVGQRNLHPDDLVSGMDRIAVWCENLVCVEETDNTVHFSHHSIREYLLQPKSGDLKHFHVNLVKFDHHAGEVCITYLNLENLKTALIEGEKAKPAPVVAVAMEALSEQTVRTAVGGSMGARVGRWTNRVVKSSARSVKPSAGDVAIYSTLGNVRHAPPAQRGIEYAFLEYAEDNWFRHRTRLFYASIRDPDRAENSMWNLVGRLLKSPRQRGNLPWKDMRWRESITTRDYQHSQPRGPLGSFVPSGCFFMPHEPESLERRERYFRDYETPEPMSDLTPIGSIPFLVVYAIQNNHKSLACRAFMTFLKQRPSSPVTKWLTLFLALEGKHSDCPNHCFARLQKHQSHYELVRIIVLCIAAGVSHWPASASERVIDDDQHWRCSKNRFLDFCKLIPTGYVAKDALRLRDFAFVTWCCFTKANASHLPGLVDGSSKLLIARTSNNMSIVDIAAEQNDVDSIRFLESFFQPSASELDRSAFFDIAIHRREIEKLAWGGLCTALRSDSGHSAKFLFEQCVDLFRSEEAGQLEQLDIVDLHQALSEAAMVTWPFDTIKNIVSMLFKAIVVKQDRETKMSHLIEESVGADNWKFAAAVVDAVSDLKFDWAGNDDPFFQMALDALSCQRCRGKQFWPEPTSSWLVLAAQRYKLCFKHKRQAVATLDPKLYLTPDKGSLQQARSSESDQENVSSDTEVDKNDEETWSSEGEVNDRMNTFEDMTN
ncbi:hypothetical protein Neosp_004225 [[Neocosmospora] mangrovei]